MPSDLKLKFNLSDEIQILDEKENRKVLSKAYEPTSGDFTSDEEDVFARLKVAQDSLIEDLECKIVISSVVGQALLKGIVSAISEESSDLLARKDAEIAHLESRLDEKDRLAEDNGMQIQKLASSYFDRLKEKELCILERERELSKMAENLVDLTFKLNGECLNSSSLDKKLKEVQARDAAKLKEICSLTEEIENLRREQSSTTEMLKRESRIKELQYRENLDEVLAENERQLGVLREENSEQQSMISALAANQEQVKGELSQLVDSHKRSMELIKELRSSIKHQSVQYEQEITILLDVQYGQMADMLHQQLEQNEASVITLREQLMKSEIETDILTVYFNSSFESLQQDREACANEKLACIQEELVLANKLLEQSRNEVYDLQAQNNKLEESMQPLAQNSGMCCTMSNTGEGMSILQASDIALATKQHINELEIGIVLECFTGFSEDVMQAVQNMSVGRKQIGEFFHLLTEMQKGVQGQSEIQRKVSLSNWKFGERRKPIVLDTEGRLLQQHHEHQLEVDILLDFFVSKLNELAGFVIERSEAQIKLSEDADTETQEHEKQNVMQVAEFQRAIAALRREKDQGLIEKTEEMFRMKRDFFKELGKLKLEGGQYEFGILKKHFADTRQKLDSVLDRKHTESISNQRFAGNERDGLKPYLEEHSDSESLTSKSESATNRFERFAGEFPLLVSELQNDIEQLMLDTGMGKPEDSSQKPHADIEELKHELHLLNSEYESVCKELEDEKCKNFALTVELPQLEHNVSLSNGELERLHHQLEAEKKERLSKEAELQNLKHDINLIRRELEVVQRQLEHGRLHKLSMEADLQKLHNDLELSNEKVGALQRELNDVLRLKSLISEDRKRVYNEVCLMNRGIDEIRNALRREIEQQTKTIAKSFAHLTQTLEEKNARMVETNARLKALRKYLKRKDVDYKRKLSKYLRNLQKAEEEVDLLGDENDYLVNLMEKVFLVLNEYASVVEHYPGISELSKLIKQELVSRMDPKSSM